MHFSTFLLLLVTFFGLTWAEGTPKASSSIQPPAGRALLYRGSNLEPWDYPESKRSGYDPVTHRYPEYGVLGPPGFWTKPSLRAHYASDIHLRYHPDLYPTPPPFEDWFKEKQIIAAINMLADMIELETHRLEVQEHRTLEDQAILLEHEIQMGELTALFRFTQIATALRYAKLDPGWVKFEESWLRHYYSLLQIGEDLKGKGPSRASQWKAHLEFVQQL